MTATDRRAIEEETVRRCRAWLTARAESDAVYGFDDARALRGAASELTVDVLPVVDRGRG